MELFGRFRLCHVDPILMKDCNQCLAVYLLGVNEHSVAIEDDQHMRLTRSAFETYGQEASLMTLYMCMYSFNASWAKSSNPRLSASPTCSCISFWNRENSVW